MDLTNLDEGSRRLLPLLARRLPQLAPDDDALLTFATELRCAAWISNRGRFKNLRRVAKALESNAIPVLLLKGAALLTSFEPDLGLRPMGDLDILVPQQDRDRALNVLAGEGWHPAFVEPHQTLAIRHALTLFSPDGRQLDLHWHLFPESVGTTLESGVWVRSAAAPNLDPASVPSPEDFLLHTIVHGVRWDVVASIRWITDAATVLRSTKIEWPVFLETTRDTHLVLPALQGLSLLHQIFDVPVPIAVLDALAEYQPTVWEHLEHYVRAHPPGVLGTLPRHLCLHLRRSRDHSLGTTALEIPDALRDAYGVTDQSLVPELLQKARRQLRRTVDQSKRLLSLKQGIHLR